MTERVLKRILLQIDLLHSSRSRALALFSASLLVFCYAAPAQSPPQNDNFADRIAISGSSITVTGALAGATIEAGEPALFCSTTSAGSVLWSWTALESTPVTVAGIRDYSFFDSSNTCFEAYAGTNLKVLTLVGSARFDGPEKRYFTFAA